MSLGNIEDKLRILQEVALKKTFIVFTYSFPIGGSAYHSTHAEAKSQLIAPMFSPHLGQSTGMELKFKSLAARA